MFEIPKDAAALAEAEAVEQLALSAGQFLAPCAGRDVADLRLEADQFAQRVALFLEPVGVDEPRRVLLGLAEDAVDQASLRLPVEDHVRSPRSRRQYLLHDSTCHAGTVSLIGNGTLALRERKALRSLLISLSSFRSGTPQPALEEERKALRSLLISLSSFRSGHGVKDGGVTNARPLLIMTCANKINSGGDHVHRRARSITGLELWEP